MSQRGLSKEDRKSISEILRRCGICEQKLHMRFLYTMEQAIYQCKGDLFGLRSRTRTPKQQKAYLSKVAQAFRVLAEVKDEGLTSIFECVHDKYGKTPHTEGGALSTEDVAHTCLGEQVYIDPDFSLIYTDRLDFWFLMKQAYSSDLLHHMADYVVEMNEKTEIPRHRPKDWCARELAEALVVSWSTLLRLKPTPSRGSRFYRVAETVMKAAGFSSDYRLMLRQAIVKHPWPTQDSRVTV